MLKIRPRRAFAATTIAIVTCLTTPSYAQSEADCAARADRAQRESNSVLGASNGKLR